MLRTLFLDSECETQENYSIPLEELFGRVLSSGQLTIQDRIRLKAVLLNDSLSENHLQIINRLLYGVRRGFLKLAT